jgi:crotonobetainyl-CoA:carnitine CoA-transferase CaiB-like acyl-CoA transferase
VLDATIRSNLAASFASKPLAAWLDLLADGHVPHAPVLTRAEFVDHPHPWENEMLVEVEHPTAGRRRMMALPVRLSDTPGRVGGPAPAFGQHSREVLRELGYDDPAIERLYGAEVVR